MEEKELLDKFFRSLFEIYKEGDLVRVQISDENDHGMAGLKRGMVIGQILTESWDGIFHILFRKEFLRSEIISSESICYLCPKIFLRGIIIGKEEKL